MDAPLGSGYGNDRTRETSLGQHIALSDALYDRDIDLDARAEIRSDQDMFRGVPPRLRLLDAVELHDHHPVGRPLSLHDFCRSALHQEGAAVGSDDRLRLGSTSCWNGSSIRRRLPSAMPTP